VLSDKGKVVPINVLTETGLRRGETALVRNDKRVAALIRLELAKEDRLATEEALRGFLKRYELPAGLSFDADRNAREANEPDGRPDRRGGCCRRSSSSC
jgi:HAE1 family hydrophobic/amphiphilic exporter-1